MFDWDVLKRGVPESVMFCIGKFLMSTFVIPTHPNVTVTTPSARIYFTLNNSKSFYVLIHYNKEVET